MEKLKERITENGIDYILVGDYYIPDLKLPEENRPIGRYGRLHREYLKQEHPARYSSLILTGKLWTYLADLNEQAEERLDLIMEQMKAAEGVTKELKARNQLEWVGQIQKFRFALKSKLIYNSNFSENGLIIGDSCRKKFGFHFTKCNAPIITK